MPRLAATALLLCAATLLAASRLDVGNQKPYDVAVIPRAGAARLLSLGHPTLAANLFWLRAVQYIGEPRAAQRGWEKLFPIVDLVTDLDPRHGYAYQVAGVMLGSVGRVSESNAILEKGMRRLPERYILPYLRAFNAFYYAGDWEAAGRFAEVAARARGAPQHVRESALAFYVKGRRADAAVTFLLHLREQAQDDESRKALDEQIRRARYEQAAGAIDEALGAYRQRRGVGPVLLGQLVEAGILPRLPDDPYGGAWRLGEDGRAASTLGPSRFRPAPPPEQLGVEPGLPSAR